MRSSREPVRVFDPGLILGVSVGIPALAVQAQQQELPIAPPFTPAVLRGIEAYERAVPYQPGRGQALAMEGEPHVSGEFLPSVEDERQRFT